MYFTRSVAKRAKTNNDCVDVTTYWCPSTSELYGLWLSTMKDRFPQFNINVYKYIDELKVDFYSDLSKMEEGYDIDYVLLQRRYPELMTDSALKRWIGRRVVVCNRKKLTWVFTNILNNPISVIEKLN